MIKQFYKYVLQSVIGMIGISVYILADTFFIAACSGVNGLAALNLMLPIYGIMYAIGAMIGIGSATQFSLKRAGKQSTDDCFFQSVFWTLFMSMIFIFSGIFLPKQILTVMGADRALIKLGIPYLRIILIGAPCFMCNYSFTAFVRNDEKPMIAMVASVSGSLFNIVFDYIFMFPLGLGFVGAGLATAISPVVTMSVCLLHYCSKSNHVRFQWNVPSVRHLLGVCRLGAPAFVGEIAAAVTTLTFNTLILSVAGTIGVAAYGVVANIALVVLAIFNGIAQGMQPLISRSYGAGNQREVRGFLKMGIITSFSVMLFILLGVFLQTDGIIYAFNQEGNKELYRYAYPGIRLYFLGFIFASINIVLVTYFAAIDQTKPAIIGSVLRGFVGIVLSAIILSEILGLTGIWLSFLSSEILTFFVIMGMTKYRKKNL